MKVYCINDDNIPDVIPVSERVVKGNPYTVTKAVKLEIGNKVAFTLAESNLGEHTFPYEYWGAERFVPEEHYLEFKKYDDVKFDIPLDIE
jgi:hypothetical protein